MNVHAGGGFAMMKRAAEALKEFSAENNIPTPKLIAVTVLTSIDQNEWEKMGHGGKVDEQVLRFAALAKEAGLQGVVASPKEAASIRAQCGKDFLIITPGIRPADGEVGDQKRIATPAAALKNGASHLVIGRPITAASDPQAATEKILTEMRQVQ